MTGAGSRGPVRPRRPVRYTDPCEGVNIEAAEDRRRFLDALADEAPHVLDALADVLPAYQEAARRVVPLVARQGLPHGAWRKRLPPHVRRAPSLVRARYRRAVQRSRWRLAWRVLHHTMAGEHADAATWVRQDLPIDQWRAVRPAFDALRDQVFAWADRFWPATSWLRLHALATLRDWAETPDAPRRWARLDVPPVSPAPEGSPEAVREFHRLSDAEARRQPRSLRRQAQRAAELTGVWVPRAERRGRGEKRTPVDGFRLLAIYQTDPNATYEGLATRFRVDRHALVLAVRKAAARVELIPRPPRR